MRLLDTITRTKQAFVEQRRSSRYATNCPAWIKFDNHGQPRSCTIVDISNGGARIAVASPNDLPKEFSVIIALGGGNITRRVRIVWWANDEIGVRYL